MLRFIKWCFKRSGERGGGANVCVMLRFIKCNFNFNIDFNIATVACSTNLKNFLIFIFIFILIKRLSFSLYTFELWDALPW